MRSHDAAACGGGCQPLAPCCLARLCSSYGDTGSHSVRRCCCVCSSADGCDRDASLCLTRVYRDGLQRLCVRGRRLQAKARRHVDVGGNQEFLPSGGSTYGYDMLGVRLFTDCSPSLIKVPGQIGRFSVTRRKQSGYPLQLSKTRREHPWLFLRAARCAACPCDGKGHASRVPRRVFVHGDLA